MKFSSAFFIVLTSFVLAGSATTPADVKADVKAISDKVAILDKSITQLPMNGATANQLLTIHSSSQELATSLQKGTPNVKGLNGVLSEADGMSILSTVKDFAPVVQRSLNMMVQKKPVFAAAGLTGDVKQSLTFLGAQSDGFVAALIDKAPTDLKEEARGLKQKMDADFVKTIAAYST